MWRDPRLEASDGAPASSPPRSPTSFDPAYASETMRRSYEALPPHHAWAPGYYYSGLGPGDTPQLQAERVKQQWHAGRSGTKLSDGSPAKPSGYAKREVESARRKPVQRVLAPLERRADQEGGGSGDQQRED